MEDTILNIAGVVFALLLLVAGLTVTVTSLLLRDRAECSRLAWKSLVLCWFCAFFYWLADMYRVAQIFAVMPAPAWCSIACSWCYRKFLVEKRQP